MTTLHHEGERSVVGLRPTPQRTAANPLLQLQGTAGNATVTRLLQDRAPQLAVQRSKSGKVDEPVDYTKTHRCGFGEGARIFSSWAYATTKLMENIPALQLSYSTGLHTTLLKKQMKNHFNIALTDKAGRQAALKKLIPGYKKILSKMGAGLVSVRCGGPHCEAGDYAYVFPAMKDNIIYLCDTTFAKGTAMGDLGCVWIHELAHKQLGVDDLGYYSTGGSTTLPTADALNNADCWGYFMIDYT